MSFYRTLLATLAAIAIASPVFAEDAASASQPATDANAPAAQSMDSSASKEASATTEQQAKVNLNKATAKELMKAGISASNARAIVKYRQKHGDFKSVDDLANLKSFKKMKEDKMNKIKENLSVE